jgi:dynein light intermediate chain
MWTQDDGSSWMQYVAKETSSRLEVVTIQQQLEQKLMQRQARETGICSVREDLYKQLFGKHPPGAATLVMMYSKPE